MNIDMIVAVVGAVFLLLIGMAVGLTVAEHGSRARDHRQARRQAELNAERRNLAEQRERLAASRQRSAMGSNR